LTTIPADSEADLIAQAQTGDRSAFGELVRRHQAGVVNVAYRLCGDVQLAEDAAQEAFIRAWLNLASYRPTSPLRNWLYRIAVNAALDALRRPPEASLDEGRAIMASEAHREPEAAYIRQERAQRVQKALLSLTPPNRAVVVLREYEELSYREIAAALDIPIGTVMSRLNYARNALRELLRPEGMLVETVDDRTRD
jgi:RNA polymerase sigma-70 factor (ECF subfamily)